MLYENDDYKSSDNYQDKNDDKNDDDPATDDFYENQTRSAFGHQSARRDMRNKGEASLLHCQLINSEKLLEMIRAFFKCVRDPQEVASCSGINSA